MPHVSRTAELRLGVVGTALTAILSLAGVAQAGDLYLPNGGPFAPPPVVYGEPGYPPPPAVYGEPSYPPPPAVHGQPGYPPPAVVYGEPRYAPPPVIDRRVAIDNGACRIVHRRHVDPYGREVGRRVRVCDGGHVETRPRWAERAPPYGYDPYYGAPRPPRAVPEPYDDLD
jgi:hypothetical protein